MKKIRMKQIGALTAAALMAVALLAGCGGQSTSASTGSGASAAPPAGGGQGAYNITFAISTAEETAQYTLAKAFEEKVEAASGGAIQVNVYPNAQLGGDREVLEAIQNNEITITATTTGAQVNFVPDLAIFDMPFAFYTLDALRYTLSDQAFVDLLAQKYEDAHFHFMGFTDTQFRVTSSNRAIHTPEDLKGLTIRTMENPYHLAAWQALGANPTPLAFNELYTALQQGTVDAQENPIELIVSQKFYEQQDYVVLTNHLGHAMGWVMSEQFYNGLPQDMQKVVNDAFADCVEVYYDFLDKNTQLQIETIQASGTEIIELSEEELAGFAALTQDVAAEIGQAVSPEVYEAFTASQQAFGSQ